VITDGVDIVAAAIAVTAVGTANAGWSTPVIRIGLEIVATVIAVFNVGASMLATVLNDS